MSNITSTIHGNNVWNIYSSIGTNAYIGGTGLDFYSNSSCGLSHSKNIQDYIISDRNSDIKTIELYLSSVGNEIIQQINEIMLIIGKVCVDYINEEEWTKNPKYRIWFDKWIDIVHGLCIFNQGEVIRNERISAGYKGDEPDNYIAFKPFKSEYFKILGEDCYRLITKYDKFNPEIFGKGSNYYYIGKRKDRKISIENIEIFLPELLSTFANTFLYRVIDMKDSKGKERKITIINQKLPKNIADKYAALTNKIDHLNPLYKKLSRYVDLDNTTDKTVIGFMPGKSYLDHIKPHIGKESLLTCDINKFYNSVNLKNIVEKEIFKSGLNLIIMNNLTKYFCQKSISIVNKDISELIIPEIKTYLDFMTNSIDSLFYCMMGFYTCNGMLPTGSYASPIITNMLLLPFDIEMANYAYNNKFRYTRYVDDICLSADKEKRPDGNYSISIEQARFIEKKLNTFGLFLKYKKTNIFGKKDNKVIANLNLPKNKNEEPSIGSKYKLELKEYFKDKEYKELNSSELGKLNWVLFVNEKQYKFIIRDIKNHPDNEILTTQLLSTTKTELFDNIINNFKQKFSSLLKQPYTDFKLGKDLSNMLSLELNKYDSSNTWIVQPIYDKNSNKVDFKVEFIPLVKHITLSHTI